MPPNISFFSFCLPLLAFLGGQYERAMSECFKHPCNKAPAIFGVRCGGQVQGQDRFSSALLCIANFKEVLFRASLPFLSCAVLSTLRSVAHTKKNESMLPPRRHTATLVLALLSLAAPPQATALKFADLFGGSASISSNASSTPSTSPAASAAASATQISGDTVFSMFRSVLGMGTSAQSSSLPRPTPSNSLLEGIDSVASPLSSIFDNAATVNSAISTSTSRNRPKHRPLSCTSYRGANEACGPTQGQCCQNGFTCADNVCKQLCPLSTYQPYCASSDDCDSSLGFTCQFLFFSRFIFAFFWANLRVTNEIYRYQQCVYKATVSKMGPGQRNL